MVALLLTNDLLKKIETAGQITEKEINLLNRRLNNGEKIDLSVIWDGEIEITPEQTANGLEWLKNQWKTPAGKERKNNPFGYREEEVISTVEKMFLRGFYDCAKYGCRSWFVPIYLVCGAGTSFEYYCSGGKIEIIW